MPIDERSISLPEQWAKDAQTVIPAPPIPGIAYRNTAITPEQWAHGQDYSRIADSAQWNQMFWVMSGLLQSAEQYGVMPYSPFTDYPELGICMGADGQLYQALQPSGPNNGGAQPTNNDEFWKHTIDATPATFIGDVRLLPFRPIDLIHCPGWHFCNGDQYALTSPVGTALNALPANFKADWGIAVSDANISIPNMFHIDGRGYFLRSVDGTTRQVGSVELDQFQTHTHIVGETGREQYTAQEVPLIRPNASGDVISSVPTGRHGIETRSLNVGMTPAIFLNV